MLRAESSQSVVCVFLRHVLFIYYYLLYYLSDSLQVFSNI